MKPLLLSKKGPNTLTSLLGTSRRVSKTLCAFASLSFLFFAFLMFTSSQSSESSGQRRHSHSQNKHQHNHSLMKRASIVSSTSTSTESELGVGNTRPKKKGGAVEVGEVGQEAEEEEEENSSSHNNNNDVDVLTKSSHSKGVGEGVGEGGAAGKKNVIIVVGNSNSEKNKALSLPKSSVHYPKAKKDSARLIEASCKSKSINKASGDGRGGEGEDGEDEQKVFLVTGTAGFVGYHVAMKLKERGDSVVGLDVVNDYYPQGLKRARLKELTKVGVHTVEADLNDQETLTEMFSICTFTHVLHLAAQAGVRYAAKNPHAYVHSNVAGFVSLMEVAVRQRPFIPRVIFASSSSIYGLNTKVPFSEDDVTDSPASLYAATKKTDELLAHTYNAIHGVAVTALRFFTVYGPLGRPDMAYFSFANNIVKGKPIKIFTGPGGSELARDFTYIDDVARGVIASCDTSEKSNTPSEKTAGKKKPKFRVYNLGNTHPVTVSDFVSTLEKHLGKEAIREYVPMPKTGDVPFTHADVSAARRDLGYEPRVSLDEGLKKFVDWYKSYYVNGKHSEDQEYVPN